MVFNVINSLTNSTKTEPNQDSLIRYLEEEHNRASNLNYIADIHISSIDKKNQVIAEIDCKLPFPSKSEITTFVTDFVNGGETQKGKTRKISLPFRKSDETAPTETPTPTEPTPVAPTTETAPTEAPTPTGPTPVAPKKTGTYQAPASQPKNTNISKAYKGISAVVLGLTVCLLSINSVALLSTQKKLAKTMDQVEKQTRVIEENNDNSTDVFSRYFISNYLRDAKTAGDFSNNDKLEKNGLNAPASVSSIMLFSKENKGDKYLMTYVVTYTVDTSTYSHKMSFEIKKSEKAKFGYLVTSDKITLSDYPK